MVETRKKANTVIHGQANVPRHMTTWHRIRGTRKQIDLQYQDVFTRQ